MGNNQRIIDACYHLRAVLTQDNPKEWDSARDEVIEAAQEELPQMFRDYETAYAQLLAMTVALEYHMRKNDAPTVGGRFLQYVEYFKTFGNLQISTEQCQTLKDLSASTFVAVRAYLRSIAYPVKPEKIRDASCKCCLCKTNLADFTGSHMIPNVLLQRFFTFDGKPKRDRESIEVYNLSADTLEHYFGHNVGAGVQQIMNRPLRDEEAEEENNKKNILKFDNYFCTDCEKRLGVLEDHYGDFLSGKIKAPDSHLAYLFWLSVFWRASLVSMAIKMRPEHEEKLRKILNNCLALKKEDIVTQDSKLGHCVYQLLETDDTKDESLGVFGLHNSEVVPYKLMIGKQTINLLMSKNQKRRFIRGGEPEESFNDGVKPEFICKQPFIAFWLQKRSIFNENYCYEHANEYRGGSRIKDYAQLENIYNRSILGKTAFSINAGLSLQSIDENFFPIPRAIGKILSFIKEHPKSSLEDLCSSLDYTKEEMEIMMNYFYSTTDGLAKTRHLWTAERE